MNNTDITSRIETLKAVMRPVQELADQLAAMQKATTQLAQMRADMVALEGLLAEAQAAKRARLNAIQRFTIIRIESGTGGLLAPRKVVYLERCHGSNGPEERPGEQWLGGTTPELWQAILANPKLIPADIRALAADAAEAVRVWAGHRARGFIRG